MNIRFLCFFLVGLFSKVAFSSEHFSDHERFCALQPKIECLTYIHSRLAGEPLNSLQWYKVKSYEFDYYYDNNQFDELILALQPYAESTQLPIEFKSQVYFYYANALYLTNNKELAKKYAVMAFDDLQQIYKSFKNPMRIIELANLQYTFGSKDTALQMLISAQRRFGKSKDPLFHFELNANKANVYQALGDLANAAKSRKVALEIISKTNQTGKITLALCNLAYAYQLLKEYDLAIKYNKQAIATMQVDNFRTQGAKVRLAELNWLKGNNNKAKRWLNEIDPSKLKQAHVLLYNKLKQQLKLQ